MFMEALEKAGINGVVSGVASAYLFGSNARVMTPIVRNSTMPLWALVCLGGVASSLATDGLHTFLKDEIPISKKSNDRASLFSGLLINAGTFAGILYFTAPDVARDFGLITALGVGAGAEWLSASGYTYLKDRMII